MTTKIEGGRRTDRAEPVLYTTQSRLQYCMIVSGRRGTRQQYPISGYRKGSRACEAFAGRLGGALCRMLKGNGWVILSTAGPLLRLTAPSLL